MATSTANDQARPNAQPPSPAASTIRGGLAPAIVLTGTQRSDRVYRNVNEIALALTRSLGRNGVPVYRFHPDRTSLDLTSRYCRHVLCPNLYDDAAGLVDFLIDFSRSQQRRLVLFPAVDGASEFISRNEDSLRPHFSLVCASRSCTAEIQNKQRLLERASQAGVSVPVTHFPTSLGEVDRISGSLAYPAVVKPLVSEHWKSAEVIAAIGPVKAVVVHDGQELRDVYRAIAPLAPGVMVQEIVPGEIERLVTFLGYVGQDGTPLAGCVRKKLRQYPSGFGFCCLTETVKDPEIMELALRLLGALDYRGIASVEFKRDPRDGRPKLIEINARAVRTTGAAIGAGVDLPWIAYQEATCPAPPAPVFEYAVPCRWIHLRSELKAALPMIWRGELGFLQWVRLLRGPLVMAVWAWDDVQPGIWNLAYPILHNLRALPRRFFQSMRKRRAK